MRFDVLTLFPDMFPGYFCQSILNKAIERGLVEIHVHNMRDWTTGRHNKIDEILNGFWLLMLSTGFNCAMFDYLFIVSWKGS